MQRTYEGILRGNRIHWTRGHPESAQPVRVKVTVVGEESDDPERGKRMAAVLTQLAERGGVSCVDDPVRWQRELRQDRELPIRED
jgi:hypothetical protein